MRMTVGVVGVGQLNQRVQNLSKLKHVRKAIYQGALAVQGEAKKRMVPDTGRLRSSLRAEMITDRHQIIGKVFTNEEYAFYQEFGTGAKSTRPEYSIWRDGSSHIIPVRGGFRRVYGTKPYPFLFPAFKIKQKQIKQALEAAFKRDCKENPHA